MRPGLCETRRELFRFVFWAFVWSMAVVFFTGGLAYVALLWYVWSS